MDFEKNREEIDISFEEYYNMLIEIVRDTSHEAYMMDVILPLLRMCCVDDIKVVPVFDDRAVGRKTNKERKVLDRMKTISAPNGSSYVVPDYILVPKDYSYDNPKKPLLMVETKLPNIVIKDDSLLYVDLMDSIRNYDSQIKAEINACKYVVVTDGFTWLFLTKDKNGKIIKDKESVSLLRKGKRNRKIYEASKKVNPPEWKKIPETIKELLKELKPK
ncbi:hypothetical protein [Ruminococcus sp.]|uniref:hypothetical protein n=1 Tax=Ruminococcus sp. TaxID=41978 RepID=UPI00386F1E3C